MCLDALLFSKIHAERTAILYNQAFMLDPLDESKHSAPNLYASDLAPCHIVSMGIEYDSFITMDLD